METIDILTRDLDWREGELGALKILLQRSIKYSRQREVLLRSAWAMLYAHYEGFSKFCLSVFYDKATQIINNCQELPEKTKIFALDIDLKKIKNLNSAKLLLELENFSTNSLYCAPSFLEVDTNSNLWPSVLERLLGDADIVSMQLSNNKHKINTLVARRNGIAHGEKNMIEEIEYYFTYEKAVYEIMYDLAYLVDERLNQSPYKLMPKTT